MERSYNCDGWKSWVLTEKGVRDPNCSCSARRRPQSNFLITSATWCTCELHKAETRETLAKETSETREAKDRIITTKDETTELEETPKSGNTLGTEEAREPTAAIRKDIKNLMETKPGTARKTGGATDTQTEDNGETTEAVRSVEAAITQNINPNDTREAMKAAAMEVIKAIGDAAKALEAIIGTQNPIDTTQDTGPNNNDKAYTTFKTYKDTINANITNKKTNNTADYNYKPIDTVEGNGVGGSNTPGPHNTPRPRDQGPNAFCDTINTRDTNPRTPTAEAPVLPNLRKSPGPPEVAVAPTNPGGQCPGAGADPHGAVAKAALNSNEDKDETHTRH